MELEKPASRAEVEAAFKKNRELSDQDLSSLDLTGIKLLGFNGERLDLSQADLSGAMIAGGNLEGANLSQTSLVGATIAGVNLEDANFTGADLSESRWYGVNVEGADFTEAITTGTKSTAVGWSSAKVAPKNLPEPLVNVPVWVPGVILGLATLVAILLVSRRFKRS